MQTNNKLFDDFAALMTSAAGAAKGMRDEVTQLVRQQGERVAADLDLAPREEVEVVKDLARQALTRLDALEARIAALEAHAGIAAARNAKPKAAGKAKSKGKPKASPSA